MKILTLVKSVLAADTAVTGLRDGGIFLKRVDQNEPRPNILLDMPEKNDDWTHQGPTGLFDAHLVVHSRGDTDSQAGLLGEAVEAALNDYTGTVYGMTVSQCRHINTMADYDDTAKVFVHVSEFRIVFRSA